MMESGTRKAADRPLEQQAIVIAGNGLAAWMTAAALAGSVDADEFSIAVVDSSDAGDSMAPFVYADSTLPSQDAFVAAPGIDELQIISTTGGSFSHGIALSGWAGTESTYIHPFGSIGAAQGPVSFHQLALRLRNEGLPVRLANYSLAALAAQSNRFVPPNPDPKSVLATCQHGLHLDYGVLTDVLRTSAEAAGVTVAGRFSHCERDPDGGISAVITVDGNRVEGTLFIDCSGIATVLADTTSDTHWQDWSTWLPCDRLVTGVVETNQAPVPYSHAEASPAGWIRHLPMQGRTVLNGFYHSDKSSEEKALNQLLESSGSDQLRHIYSGRLRFGRRNDVWQRNCVSLGTAAALLEPLAISNLQLLSSGIHRLLRLLPAAGDCVAVGKEYNRQMALLLDNARDFTIIHYKLNGRHGEPFWDACRRMSVPETLAYKIQLFESRGRLPLYDEEPLEESSWLNLFDEHGLEPRNYNRLADGFSLQDLQKHLQRVRTVMLESLQRIPLHADYLTGLKNRPATGKTTGN